MVDATDLSSLADVGDNVRDLIKPIRSRARAAGLLAQGLFDIGDRHPVSMQASPQTVILIVAFPLSMAAPYLSCSVEACLLPFGITIYRRCLDDLR